MSVHRGKFLQDSNSLSTAVHDVDGGIRTAQNLTKQLPLTSRADLIAAYNVVFNGQLGRFNGQVHLEVSRDARQVVMPTRRVQLAMEDRLASELSRLENMGVIGQPSEPSQWVSSLVIAEKKDGSLRVCTDPLFLNKALVRNPYQMTTMEEILPRLAKAKVFTVVDVKSGYWHVVLDEESSHRTTFGTPNGRYRWLRLLLDSR